MPWKSVQVELPGQVIDQNHYDDKLDVKMLEAQPAEAVGLFYGLERIDGSQYSIIEQDGSKVMVLHKEGSENDAPEKKKMTETKKSDDSKHKKKRKKKAKKEEAPKEAEVTEAPPKDQVLSLQNAWMTATGGVVLEEPICQALWRRQFWSPTPIQSTTLPAAILGRCNIVGAAPTGSGKTLSFLLPIITHLLTSTDTTLQALILTPTRELALQIKDECHKLLPKSIGAIVGGLAHVKQARILTTLKPSIIVGTPGRLWELIHGREFPHLNDLSQLRFLVIDEADRMVQDGTFEEMTKILDAVQAANPMDDDDESEEEVDEDDLTDPNRLFGLPGVPGEAKLQMLNDDILRAIEQQRTGEAPKVDEHSDEESESEKDSEKEESDSEDEISLPARPPVFRQTFVYSATLTLPASGKFIKSNKRLRLNKDVDGAIAEILGKSRAKGKTKVVDLTNADKSGKGVAVTSTGIKQKGRFQLPPGLTLQQIKCSQMHKDSHLYAYLTITEEGSKGPALVFCNSIAGVRRVGSTLKLLGFEVKQLHAQMQQKTRFKALEKLKESKERIIVVATDVAARGLDVESISAVIQYDIPRSIDTFVHRSGRTARGMGKDAVGNSLALISPAEDRAFSKIQENLEVSFENVPLDGRLLSSAQERVSLASKVLKARETENKRQHSNNWFKSKAAEAGIELDEDLLEDSLVKGDKRDRSTLKEADKAAERLSKLLKEPLTTQRYGKFLSTARNIKRIDPAVSTSKRPSKKQRRN